ncbi:MAG: hypothetical protein ACI9UA_004366, partial [Pseudoalteromonas tetraodonis]
KQIAAFAGRAEMRFLASTLRDFHQHLRDFR